MHTLKPLITDAAIQADKLRLARLLTDAIERGAETGERRRLAEQRNALVDSLRANLRVA